MKREGGGGKLEWKEERERERKCASDKEAGREKASNGTEMDSSS